MIQVNKSYYLKGKYNGDPVNLQAKVLNDNSLMTTILTERTNIPEHWNKVINLYKPYKIKFKPIK